MKLTQTIDAIAKARQAWHITPIQNEVVRMIHAQLRANLCKAKVDMAYDDGEI